MTGSDAVRDSLLRFYERLSAGDVASFDDLVSQEAALIIGTAPGEWVEERAAMRFGFETEGLRIEGDAPRGYEEGAMGWAVDNPTMVFPDGSAMKTRLTVVLRCEEERWKIVHAHFSVAVPDEEVVELQQRWAAAGS